MSDYCNQQARLIEKDLGEDYDCTVLRSKGADCLFELTDGGMIWRGWLYDGESNDDIRWEPEGLAGWPDHLK